MGWGGDGGVHGWGERWRNGEVSWWTWTGTGDKAWIWKGGNAGELWCRAWGGGGCTVDENEICFWNMHGQWNKTKGEGERVRQEIIQRGGGGGRWGVGRGAE